MRRFPNEEFAIIICGNHWNINKVLLRQRNTFLYFYVTISTSLSKRSNYDLEVIDRFIATSIKFIFEKTI